MAHAQVVLNAALQAGFRESGAINITSDTPDGPTPMVAIRSMGMSLESVIGMLDDNEEGICIVSEDYLQGLLAIANERFEENTIRIARFRNMLLAGNANLLKSEPKKNEKGEDWEDAAVRRERKRAEGLQRSEELKKQLSTGVQQTSYP